MDCISVLNCKKEFFNGDLTLTARDAIISHLLRCETCHNEYASYAESLGLVFDIVREASKVYAEYDLDGLPESVDMIINPKIDLPRKHIKARRKEKHKEDNNNSSLPPVCLVDKWVTAHRLNDYSALMNVKAIREIYNEQIAMSKSSEEARLFIQFLTKKICQKIDLFEKCLKMEVNSDA